MLLLGTGSFLLIFSTRVPSLPSLGYLSPVVPAALGPSADRGTSCTGGFVRGAPHWELGLFNLESPSQQLGWASTLGTWEKQGKRCSCRGEEPCDVVLT